MKLCRLYIQDFQQFRDLELDFTHPETGEPLEKVCFIGSNGTGKSTLLRLIEPISRHEFQLSSEYATMPYITRVVTPFWAEFTYLKEHFFVICLPVSALSIPIYIVSQKEDAVKIIESYSIKKLANDSGFPSNSLLRLDLKSIGIIDTTRESLLKIPISQIITCPAEVINNTLLQITDVPQTTLNSALDVGRDSGKTIMVSAETAVNFWNRLIFHVRERDRQREEFENQPENLDKTKRRLTEEFDRANPKILDKLAEIWSKILDKAGLQFSVDKAKLPIQLTDNLLAYITLKSTGQTIAYNQLSTGIRNFIFRIGHIYSLYFNRKIKNGFLLVDEPENSLFPDFLLDLIGTYQQATTDQTGQQNTQLFFATHNPIIAAQFEPFERVILDWGEIGHVVARRGMAPLGDNPDDLLIKDFEISSLAPEAGIAVWEHYLNLKKQLRRTQDETEQQQLVSEISRIGYDHSFPQ